MKAELIKKAAIKKAALLQKEASGTAILTPLYTKEGSLKSYLEGRDVGVEEGYQRAIKDSERFSHLIQTIAKRLLDQKEELLSVLKPELINLAIIVCEKVIRKELGNPSALVKLIDAELQSISQNVRGEVINILLSPADFILLEKHLSKISYDKKEIKRVRFHSDPKLQQGDFRIETEKSLVNCSIQRELEDLKQKILLG